MTPQRAAALVSFLFAVFVVQLLGALPGPLCSGVVATLAGAAGAVAVRRLDFVRVAVLAPLIAAASAFGVLLPFVSGGSAALWLSPVAAAVTTLALGFGRRPPAQVCVICGRTVRELVFTCPRCLKPVCDNDECWIYGAFRCRRCDEKGVPVLTEPRSWWISLFGNPLPRGTCQLCLTDASQIELFACPQCGRAQCRDCWDHANGQCSGCAWVIPGLPEQLMAYLHVNR